MRRAGLFLLILLVSTSLLFAEVWRSNALSQKIEKRNGLLGQGWEREDEGDSSALYYDGVLQSTRYNLSDGYLIEEGEKSERVYLDEKGNIVRKISEDGERRRELNYFYENGILSSISESEDGKVAQITEYYSTPDGTLLGLRKEEKGVYFLPERVVYSLEGEINSLSFSKEETEETREIVYLDEGGYTERRGESLLFHDGNGRLVREETAGEIKLYSYNREGELLEVRRETEDEVSLSEYERGRVRFLTSMTKDGVTLRTREYKGDGTILETRYIDGEARYTFLFDRDGERILEARGL